VRWPWQKKAAPPPPLCETHVWRPTRDDMEHQSSGMGSHFRSRHRKRDWCVHCPAERVGPWSQWSDWEQWGRTARPVLGERGGDRE
jgi:hypothetical protein